MTPARLGFIISALTHVAVLLPLISADIPAGLRADSEQKKMLTLELEAFSTMPEPEESPVHAPIQTDAPRHKVAKTVLQKPMVPLPKPTELVKPRLLVKPVEISKPSNMKIQPAIANKPNFLDQQKDISKIRLLEQRYITALKKAIEARKFYPSRAKKQAREGVVIVGFRIDRKGKINNVRIVGSSSVRILDKSAMNVVSNMGKFKPIPEQIKRESWTFEISLSYYLL